MRVLVGVTGGVAAYKSLPVIRELRRLNHEVRVVATESAFKFVGRESLAALSENPVETELFADSHEVKHIEIARWAELILIAPATASLLSRLASGSAWDLLDNIALAASCPMLVAPAMHTEMWQNPATVANVAILKSRGISVLEPESGWLSSGDFGAGRLPEPELIVAAALALRPNGDLQGIDAVVTAGGTQEDIDPVRYIGNRSSGKTGVAIAKELERRGANVTVIACNLQPAELSGLKSRSAHSAEDLERELRSMSPRLLVMAAAVSDFTFDRSATKLARSSEDLRLSLRPTRDLLAAFASQNPDAFIVGFALQDAQVLKASATRKLTSKGVDMIVANDLESLAGDETRGYLIANDLDEGFSCSKQELAKRLVDEVVKRISVSPASRA